MKILTASLLVSLTLTVLLACTTQKADIRSKPEADPPTVAFCDLVADPTHYDGKVVRTEAIVAVGFEIGIVYDPKCGEQQQRAWYDFDESTYKPDEPGWKALRSLLFPEKRGAGHYRGRAKAIMIGRFDASKQNGYGHMNGYHFLFTIMRVERAQSVPSDVPD